MPRQPDGLPALLHQLFAASDVIPPGCAERLNAALTAEADAVVLAQLHAFFTRCYRGGTFVATPPSSEDEVSFHWRHAGQYYVQASEDTADSFIHLDLDSALRRELDRFIKEQVLHLDEGEECLRQCRELRRVAEPIFALLTEREELRKRAWLRKKLVCETHYCVALAQVPEELYAEVAANAAQREEWLRLFGGECLEDADSSLLPLAFLRTHPYLPVDTAWFGPEFKDRLLAAHDNLDDSLSAIAFHADSTHGLSLIQARYAGRIDTIYLDPPFNTDNTEFPYKNDYGHSAWLSLMDGLLRLARPLLSRDGSLFAQIDHHEATHLKMLLTQIFGPDRFVNEIIWRRKQATSYSRKQLGIINDTIWWFANSATYRFVPQYTRDDDHTRRYIAERFVHRDEATGRYYMKSPLVNSMDRPNLKYVFHGVPPPPNGWLYSQKKMEELFQKGELVLPDKPGGRIYRKIFADTYPGQRIQNLWLDIPIVNPMAHERIDGFATQKPAALVERVVALSTGPDSVVLDFFAGSGTTYQAVLDANRKDGGRRRVLFMEMGEHFDRIMLPRMKRLLAERAGAVSGFKYLRLETYEEALQYPDGGIQRSNFDLVETFNWLLGLTVRRNRCIDGVRVIEGTNPRGQPVLNVWRDSELMNNERLSSWLVEQGYTNRQPAYEVIYVNGGLAELCWTNQPGSVRCIEDDFLRLLHQQPEATPPPPKKDRHRRANR